MARNIRLRFTGLVMFLSRVVSILTGLAFVTIVTRNVSLTEYGVWQYVVLLVSYFVFPNCVLNYWVTRYVARGLKAAKTGLTMNLTISLLAFVALFFISPYAAKTVNADSMYFIIGSLMIPTMYAGLSLEAVAQGSVPHINAYSFLTFEITKVILGVVTILYMKTGLFGALFSVFIAYVARAIFLSVTLRDYITKGDMDWSTAKKWLKTGWIPLYSGLAPVLISLDALIVTLLTSSTEPIALWRAALMITGVVGYSVLLASALYPKLLAGGSEKDVETSLKLVLMFAVPLAVGAMLLAEPLLRIFKFKYAIAGNIIRVNAISVFLSCIGGVSSSIIIGTEKIDTEDVSFKKLLKSRLFLLPTLSYLNAATYLPLVFVVTTAIVSFNIEPIYFNVAFACNLIALLASVVIVTYTYKLAKRILPFKFPITSLGKYVLASAAMATIIVLFYPMTSPQTLALVLVSAIVYFLILLAIDEDTRNLVNSILAVFKTGNIKSAFGISKILRRPPSKT